MIATHSRRACYGLAAAFVGAALINAWLVPDPEWFAVPVTHAAGLFGMCYAALIVVLEVVAQSRKTPRAQWFLFVYAAVPLLVGFAVCRHAWSGRPFAQAGTWHLIVFSTVVNFILMLAFAAMVVGFAMLVLFARERARRDE